LGLYKSNASLIVHYHSVIFDQLKPDTVYVYRVGDGDARWSEWIQFRTAHVEYAPTQFIYFGDVIKSGMQKSTQFSDIAIAYSDSNCVKMFQNCKYITAAGL